MSSALERLAAAKAGKRKPRKPATWNDAKRHLKNSHKKFAKLIRRRIEELKPNEEDRQRFMAFLGTKPIPGPLRMSNVKAHYRFARFVTEEVRDLCTSKGLDFFFLTLLADEGIMSDRRPRFSRRQLMRKAYKALLKAGLEGIFVVEVQPLINWPQNGKGRALLAHIHILAWAPQGTGTSAKKVRKSLGSGKNGRDSTWSCRFGAKPIHVKALTPKQGCPSFWAAYLLKLPYYAKSRIPRKLNGKPGSAERKFKFRAVYYPAYRSELAMRLFELMGQQRVRETVGGLGSGAAILKRCENRLYLWDKQRREKWAKDGVEEVPAFDEEAFWTRTHKRRTKRYHPFFIDNPTMSPRARKGRK